MPWSLIESSGEDGNNPAVQLRFVRSRADVQQQPSAYSLLLAQYQQNQKEYGHLAAGEHQQHHRQNHQRGAEQHHSPVRRHLPASEDPENVDPLPRGRGSGGGGEASWMRLRGGAGGLIGGGGSSSKAHQPSIFKPSIFGTRPPRQRITFHGKNSLSSSSAFETGQQQHQAGGGSRRPMAAAEEDVAARRKKVELGEGAGGAEAKGEISTAAGADGGTFRLPLLPTDRLGGGSVVARGKGRGGARPSPRVAQPSPRDVLSDALLVERRGAQLTPRTQKEADMAVAREAQRKNMIMAQVKKLGNKDWTSRKVAVDALASLCAEDSSVLEYVMALMDSRSDKSRQTAVWAIQRIVNKGHVEAIEMLMRRLEHPGEEVRMAALSALSNVAVKGQAAAIQSAVKRLGHQSWTTREAAVDALQHVALQGDACAIEGLAECIRIDKDWRVRQVAVEGMAGLLDASLGSVRVALQCFAAVCDGAQGAAEGPAMHLSLSCYRSMLSKCGIPSHVGECSRGCRAGDGESKFKCRACVEGVKQWAGSRLWQGMALAFAMGSHQRVGCDSWVGRLDPELIPLILAYA